MRGNKICQTLHTLLSRVVFTSLDILDSIFCIVYSFLDEFFEGTSSSCYCHKKDNEGNEDKISETLYGRQNMFRNSGFYKLRGKLLGAKDDAKGLKNRWSDCGCESCISGMKKGDDYRLHIVVQEPEKCTAHIQDIEGKVTEDVIFLHGFISSSSFWTETVFANVSDTIRKKYRLLAADLLGFGKSPKPRDCLYTLEDHVEMIEKSIVVPFELKSFHLVAHSMGSIIALHLAAKHSQYVKSVTLIAPPYFPSTKEGSSLMALTKLAGKKLWPPLLFGASFMSWYEHLGRTFCFIICKNHRIWEFLVRIFTRRRDLHYMITDLTRHTHHSAWHTMHNVVCGGAKSMEQCLEILSARGVKITVIQGDEDQVVPLECSYNIKLKVPEADVRIIPKTDHITVVLNQTKEFTRNLESIWMSCNHWQDPGSTICI